MEDDLNLIDDGMMEFYESREEFVIKDGKLVEYNGKSASVVFPQGITEINKRIFSYCTSLVSVTFADGITKIGNGAFRFCESLKSIVIPDSVTEIGYGVFEKCTSLESARLPKELIYIGENAFLGCTKLASINIPKSVRYIDYNAFSDCGALKVIRYEGTMEQWNEIEKGIDLNTMFNLYIPDAHWADTTRGRSWNNGVYCTSVECTDGRVLLK